MINKISVIQNVPLLINTMKRLMDEGEELLVLKHVYDLTNQEVEEILNLYEIKDAT